MTDVKKTVLFDSHKVLGAKMVDFAGCLMPLQYSEGIIAEHLNTRRYASIFDVSHMGRFVVRGGGAAGFLRYVLTNDASKLKPGKSHYTILANNSGGAVDDAYLYCLARDDYILVVNASNREKDWAHLTEQLGNFKGVELQDSSDALAMLALQGPESENILGVVVEEGTLPESGRNTLSSVVICGQVITAARTGYTGEPICFELILPAGCAVKVWQKLISAGAKPAGLGARDTLRLEAGLPLYGHEFGVDSEGKEIPIFASALAKFAVDLGGQRGNFIGRVALYRQYEALKRYGGGDYIVTDELPRLFRQVAVTGQGICRAGAKVFAGGKRIGRLSSGSVAPCWKIQHEGDSVKFTGETDKRSVATGLLDCRIKTGSEIQIDVRGKLINAIVVKGNIDNRSGRYALPIIYDKTDGTEE